jgi:hypothetical protein
MPSTGLATGDRVGHGAPTSSVRMAFLMRANGIINAQE